MTPTYPGGLEPSTSVAASPFNFNNWDNLSLTKSLSWLNVVMNCSSLLGQDADSMERVKKESDKCPLSTNSTSAQPSNPQHLQHGLDISKTRSGMKIRAVLWRAHNCNKVQHQRAVCEGIKDYHCTFCNQKFGQKSVLRRHVTALHK